MGILVGGGRLNSSADVIPGCKTTSLQSQRTQHFPPGFDQVQIGGVLGLKDKLPTRMGQAEQQQGLVKIMDTDGDSKRRKTRICPQNLPVP